jgi:hypothetical protein
MNEFLAFLSLIIAFAIMVFLVCWIDNMRFKRIIKQYNKTHPHDLKDYEKSSISDMYKQYLEFYIFMFAKNSDGISLWQNIKTGVNNYEK